MKNPDLVWNAIKRVVRGNVSHEFKRAEILQESGVKPESFSSVFQHMCVEQPGGAPNFQERLKAVLTRSDRGQGWYTLSPKGEELLKLELLTGPAKQVATLSIPHSSALEWFANHAGQVVPWPGEVDGVFLANKAKGIHKPAGLDYALSVRQSLGGPYEDAVTFSLDGRWELRYAYEGSDAEFFTNRGLRRCLEDGVPVGVIVQVKGKPASRYRVLGLGRVIREKDGHFTIVQGGSGPEQVDVALDVALPGTAFDASRIEDERIRTMRSIALRRGQPEFRKALLNAYEGRCAVTGCTVALVLEAAHIIPYAGDSTNHVANGLLLRADIHTLFDLGLLTIDSQNMRVVLHDRLKGSEYESIRGKRISTPVATSDWPDQAALATRVLASSSS